MVLATEEVLRVLGLIWFEDNDVTALSEIPQSCSSKLPRSRG